MRTVKCPRDCKGCESGDPKKQKCGADDLNALHDLLRDGRYGTNEYANLMNHLEGKS